RLERDVALRQLAAQDVQHHIQVKLVVGEDLDAILLLREGRFRAAKVEAPGYLALRLVNRVLDLSQVYLRDDVERVFGRHPTFSPRLSLQLRSRPSTASLSEVSASSIWRSSGWGRRSNSRPESVGRKSIMRCATGERRVGTSATTI